MKAVENTSESDLASGADIYVEPVQIPSEWNNPSLRPIFYKALLGENSRAQPKMRKELEKIAAYNAEIDFLNKLRGVLSRTNSDGSFEINDQLKNLLNKATSSENKSFMHLLERCGIEFTITHSDESFEDFFSNIDTLDDAERKNIVLDQLSEMGIEPGKKPSVDELKKLVKFITLPENADLRQGLQISTKDKLTKTECDAIVQSILSVSESNNTAVSMCLHKFNEMKNQFEQLKQTLIQLYNQYEKDMRRPLENLKRT